MFKIKIKFNDASEAYVTWYEVDGQLCSAGYGEVTKALAFDPVKDRDTLRAIGREVASPNIRDELYPIGMELVK